MSESLFWVKVNFGKTKLLKHFGQQLQKSIRLMSKIKTSLLQKVENYAFTIRF